MNYGISKPPMFSNKKEKGKTLFFSFIGMIIGALALYGVIMLGTEGNFFMALLGYLCGLVVFISFWVFVISLFEK